VVDGGDTAVERVAGRLEPDGLAVDQVLARFRSVGARQDLDQRGLPGAVVAEHAGDLPGPHRRGHAGERHDVPVVLGHAADLEQGL
jgi:hypothetical protein